MVNKGQSIAYGFLDLRYTTFDLFLHRRIHFSLQKLVNASLGVGDGGAGVGLGIGPLKLPIGIPQMAHGIHRLLQLINRVFHVANALLDRAACFVTVVEHFPVA